MKIKKPYLIDIPVLFIFFVRPEQTKLVFKQIKLARPSKLYLYQDGARLNALYDVQNIDNCRSIVEDIDWDCKIYNYYQKKNIGCDPSEFIAQKWMFEHEEYGIILEDDDVPSQSFFPFCKELLEKYKNDERINMICGMNHLGESQNNPYSYLFTTSGSIWGWASWKRVVDKWEEHYDFLKDLNALNLIKNKLGTKFYKTFYKTCLEHNKSGKAYYESINEASTLLNDRLNIVPSKNMISNIGVGLNTTHSVDSMNKLPKGIRRVFYMATYEIEFPLKHPEYIIEDVAYKKKVDRIMANGHIIIAQYRLVEGLLRRIMSGDFASLYKGLRRRMGK